MITNVSDKRASLHRKSSRKAYTNALRLLLNLPLLLIIIFPLIYTFSVSIMHPGEIYSIPPRIFPRLPHFNNYVQVIVKHSLHRYVINSFLVSTSIMLCQMVTCSLAAFSFSFLRFRGRRVLFMLTLATMMVPAEATIIANFLTISGWNLTDSYAALIAPYMTSAMGIFLLRQHYLAFAKELHEAARIDGCNNPRFLVSIVMPLSRPALGALGAYAFLNAWNMYMWPLLVTNSNQFRTVQVGITMLYDVDAEAIGLMMAGVMLVTVPSLTVFIFMQKQLINGLMAGAVKG